MGGTTINIKDKPGHNVEIVLHVDEALDEVQRADVARYLEEDPGINSCFFCNNRFHLMLVNFDRNRMTSQDVLSRLKSQQYGAELIGPV